MKATRLILLAALALPCFAQGVISSGSIPGFTHTIQYETRMDPPGPVSLGSRNLGFGGNMTEMYFDRALTDSTRKTYFGYRILATTPVAGYTRVSFRQLPPTANAVTAGFTGAEEWTAVGVGGLQGTSALVPVGGTLELVLFRNPQSGQKVVEHITILPPDPKIMAAGPTVHDFGLADVELSVMEPRLMVNGTEEHLDFIGLAAGKTLWLNVKGKGRYTLSITPAAGFERMGQVRGNSLNFRAGGDEIALFDTGRIAPGNGIYHLYVHFDPNPKTARSNIMAAVPQQSPFSR
jgi:hypothetical protein